MDLFDFALYLALNKGGGGGGAPIDDNTISPSKTWSSQKIDNTKANKAPHNYAFDGVDLSTIFADADELYAAYSQEDYGKIHIGDYWPVTLNGTFRDYGMMTCQQGQTYYSDTELTTAAGTADADYDATPVGDANIPGCHKPYCEVTINKVKYYCAYDECLEYREKTQSQESINTGGTATAVRTVSRMVCRICCLVRVMDCQRR